IQADFVDPDAAGPAGTPEEDSQTRLEVRSPPSLASMVLGAVGSVAERDALATAVAEIESTLISAEWDELKYRLAALMSAADFWHRPDRHETLVRLALMDRVAAALGSAQALSQRLDRGARRTGGHSQELVGRLALQLYLLREGIKDVFAGDPVEVAVGVEPAFQASTAGKASGISWAAEIQAMYMRWSDKRRMQVSELQSGETGRPPTPT